MKRAENLKLVFRRTVSPESVTVSFQAPLTNPPAVSAEAWTQGQLIGPILGVGKALYSFCEIRSPRPHPVHTGSQSPPLISQLPLLHCNVKVLVLGATQVSLT